MNRVFVLLGSNVDKERNLPAAVALLRSHGLVAISPVYETAPVGTAHSATFFNAAAEILTPLDPAAFKRDVCGAVEWALGRVRDPRDKFAPRTIDLDIALWNDEVLDVLGSPVPDPDILCCLHAALPLADLAPEVRHPADGRTLAQIARELAATGATNGEVPGYPRRRSDVII
ncbi:MAG: 2-amino-4-hydroxy-6-hydroxymethyldihydropteridine diphosphokinase [Candidatus Krumholzibacteria bacterium]|nr:2-amino-4-hydroxy-6-hydroxymethyldihydropteridine diphosphokinase [Candidatus Krumholzibacteria bacterium]